MTLLEILVAVLILALVIGGLVNIFTSSKAYVVHTRSWITAAEAARYFLDPLQANVSNTSWGTSCLGSQSCTASPLQLTQLIPGSFAYNYIPTYTISDGPVGNLTRVVLNITWNETTP